MLILIHTYPPSVFSLQNFLSIDECEHIIGRAKVGRWVGRLRHIPVVEVPVTECEHITGRAKVSPL